MSSSRRTSKSDQSPRGSSFVTSSAAASTWNDSNSYNQDSWKSSVSSHSSLSSLRQSLPENPVALKLRLDLCWSTPASSRRR
ncbi:hypothetical protein L2E82_21946 [Cichorium intybus]|uniref:Uncharacterized protein n=1 Tax=Cichorium intybus TaxID=13427 RepID=A0ACB9DXC1_CICIN|nr:hypothetical protein L2E82_21946 [Cichorium intybus]